MSLKVCLAMSGGVDSAVAGLLLKQAGFQITGVFFKLWHVRSQEAYFKKTEKNARQICRQLKIDFQVWDMHAEFKKQVVDYFIQTYDKNLTPNPCVVCNQKIKFGQFIKLAKKQGFDYIATGHYAKVKYQNNQVQLLKAKDKDKDQSYFLYKLSQSQLKHILFPVGDYTKIEIKKIAQKNNLIFKNTVDSQEVCFINTKLDKFLKSKIEFRPGKIIDINSNQVLGQHNGIQFYTIGQRKNIGLAGGPWYVVKNIKNDLLVTNFKNDPVLFSQKVKIKNINWISGTSPKLPIKIKVKIRYRHQPAEAILKYISKTKSYQLEFNKPQRAVTPGQSAVFYQGQQVLGGGEIKA
ncbi:MAG: tRNA 2-thiouridine(34) synthase MnmA [Patescibacteria group bacterium]|nr:tRNA 2-thiouridine(34) synthase MnmA [Patescibacteria group bacterium]